MGKAVQHELRARIVVTHPVPGVLHSLQQDDAPLDPKRSTAGEPLAFEFGLRAAAKDGGGYRFFGKQVRPEGRERQFVYVRIGKSAGDPRSEWNRKMKVDIHEIEPALVERALAGAVLEGRLNGTANDGSPACATIRPVHWSAA